MTECTYRSPLFDSLLQFFVLVGIVTFLLGIFLLSTKDKDVRKLGLSMLAVAGLNVLILWLGLQGSETRYRVESQVKTGKPVGQLQSVTRSTQKSFLIDVDGRSASWRAAPETCSLARR